MLRKPLTIAAIALTAGATLLPTEASAGDPGLGALVGGVFSGRLDQGATCRSSLECREGLHCVGVSPLDPGTCQPPQASPTP